MSNEKCGSDRGAHRADPAPAPRDSRGSGRAFARPRGPALHAYHRMLPALALALGIGVLGSCGSSERVSPSGDIGTRVEAILRNPNVLERNRDLAALLLDAPKEAAPAIAGAFKDVFSEWGDNELVLLAEWWGPLDPEAAYAWGLADWRARHPRFLYALMRSVARQDPQAAIALYRTYPPAIAVYKQDYPMELEGIVTGWYESGKPELIEFLVSQPTPALQQQTLGTFARLKVLELGARGAIEWAEQAAREDVSGNTSRYVLQRIAASVGEVDGPLAAEWAERQVALGESVTLIQRVAARWVRREPERTMEWLSKFDPLNNDYQMAVDMTFRDWNQLNLAGARAWLDSKGDERFGWLAPATGTALRFQAYGWQQSRDLAADWTGALDTALKLPERAGLKWGTAAVITSFWLNRDAAAAEAWMKSAGMPEAFQIKARQRAENPRP